MLTKMAQSLCGADHNMIHTRKLRNCMHLPGPARTLPHEYLRESDQGSRSLCSSSITTLQCDQYKSVITVHIT